MRINDVWVVAVRFSLAFILSIVLGSPALAQRHAIDDMRGSDFVAPISCAQTTFEKITDRFGHPVGSDLANLDTSGMDVTFGNGVVLISYEVSQIAVHEYRGSKVQLCYLGHVEGTKACLPSADPRGRYYRVYDYRLHAAWIAMNSQHACGGA